MRLTSWLSAFAARRLRNTSVTSSKKRTRHKIGHSLEWLEDRTLLANRFWVGPAGANWSDPNSWAATSGGTSGASVPGTGDDVFFDANGNTNSTIDTGVAFGGTIQSLTISSGYTQTITLNRSLTNQITGGTDGTLTISGGTLAMGANDVSVEQLVVSGGTITGTTGVLTDTDNTSGFDVQSGDVSAILAGAVTLNKSTAGTVILSGANTYTGLTSISQGTLKLGAAGSGANTPLGTTAAGTTVSATGATLDLNGFTLATAEALTLNGTGISSGGALTNSSGTAVTYSGLLTLGSASSIVAGSGDIVLSNTGTITGSGFGLTLNGTSTGSSLASILGTGAGTLTKSGTGTWTVSGSSTYTGLTTISQGTLKLGATGAGANSPLGTTAAGTTVTSGAVLDLNGFALATAEPVTINGTGISAAGALINSSGSAASLPGNITLGSDSTIGGSGNATYSGTVNGGSNLTLDGAGTKLFSGIIGGGTPLGSLNQVDGSGAAQFNNNITLSSGGAAFNANLTLDGLTLNSVGAITFGNTAADSLTISGAATTVTTTGGLIRLDATTTGNENLTLNSSGGVTFNAPVNMAVNKNLSGTSTSTTVAISLPNSNSDITSSGTGTVSLTATRNISFGNGSSISTVNGGITLNANTAATTTGDFDGILLNGATLSSTGSGGVSLNGTGGTSGGGTHNGVQFVSGTGPTISSSGGAIQITGVGGTGTSTNMAGILVDSGTITATGTATITLTGTGGVSSGDGSRGVLVRNAGTAISSVNGDIQINGRAIDTTGNGGDGVATTTPATVTTTGTGQLTVRGSGNGANGGGINSSATYALTGVLNTFIADKIGITGSINAGSNTVTVRQANAADLTGEDDGDAINIGSAVDTTANTLELSDTELDFVTAGTINIGNTTSGAITISAAIDRSASTNLVVTTASGNTIAFSGASSLSSAGGNITLTTSGAGAITSGTSATDITAGAGTISFSAGSGGIGASGNPLVLSGTSIDATTTGNANQFLSASGSILIDTTGLSAGTGTIEINAGTFTLGSNDRIANASKLNVNGATATFALGTFNETVNTATLTTGSITSSTGILTSTNTIQVQSGSVSAILAGTNGLTKSTGGTVTLSGTNTYSGTTSITGGTLALSSATNNNIALSPTVDVGASTFLDVTALASSQLNLASGQTLQGTGTVSGRVNTLAGSTISPNSGAGTGILNIDNGGSTALSFQTGSTFTVQVNGNVAGTNYDQLNVTGTVSLSNATLSTSGTVSSVPSQVIILINNDGTDAVTGTFNGLAEGATVTINSIPFVISYAGGVGGNDVVLIQAGTVTYTGTPVADSLEVRETTTAGLDFIQYYIGGVLTDQRLSSTVSAIQVDGGAGNDTLTINYNGAGGFFNKAVTFNGQGQTSTPGDTLVISGGTFTTITNTFTNANDGTINLDGTLVTYTGLEPVLINVGSAANIVFNFPGAGNTAFLEDDGVANTLSQLRSSPVTFETTTFVNPTDSLTINMGAGSDSLTITSLPDFNASLTVDGGASADSITLSNNITLGSATSNGNLSFTAETINLGANINTDAGTNHGNVTLSGSTAINVTTGVTIDTNGAGTDGTLSVTGPISADGQTLTLDVGPANNVTLNNAGNNFGTVAITTANNVTLVDTTAIVLGASTISGTLSITASGNITDSANVSVTGNATFAAGTGAITLGSAGETTNYGSLTFTTTGAVTIEEDSQTDLTGTLTANSLSLTSSAAIVDANGTSLTVTNDASFNGTSVTLGDNGGDTTNFGSLSFASAGAVTITEDSDMNLAGTNTAGTLILTVGSGSTITVGGTSTTATGTATLNAGAGVTVNAPLQGTVITISGDTNTNNTGTVTNAVAGTITATTGSVTITAADVSLAGTISANGGAGDVFLQTSANLRTIGLAGGAGDFAVTDAEADLINASRLVIGAANAGAITIGGSFSPATPTTLHLRTNGGVSTSGGGSVTVNNLAISANGSIILTNPNSVTNLAITNTTNSVSFTESNGLNVADVVTPSGTISGITTPTTVTLTVNAGNLTVENTSAANDISGTGFTGTVSGVDAVFTLNASANIQVTGATTAITADDMDLQGTITATGQTVLLQPNANNQLIDVGSAGTTANGTLELSDPELDRVTATTIQVGRASAGALTVSLPINTANTSILHLITGSTVSQSGTGAITETSLAITAGGAVSMNTNANTVSNLAISTTTGNINFTNNTTLSVTTVDTVTGISTAAGNVLLTNTSGDVTVVNTGAANDISATTGITITLNGNDATFTVNGSADVETVGNVATNDIIVNADEMVLTGTITASGSNQIVTLRNTNAGELIILGTNPGTAGVLELSDAELDNVSAGSALRIGRNDGAASGNISFTSGITAPAGWTTLHLITGAAVNDDNAANPDVTVTNLAVDSVSGIAAAGTNSVNGLEVLVTNLAFNNTASNSVQFTEATGGSGFTVNSVDGVTTSNNGGTTTTLTANSPVTFAVNTTSVGTITTNAVESAPTNFDNITVNAGVTVRSTGGDVLFNAGDRIIITNTSTVRADVGNIVLTSGVADTDNDGSQTLDGTIRADNSTTTRVTIDLSAEAGSASQAGTGTILAGQLRLLSTTNGGSFSLGTSATNDVDTIAAATDGSITYRDVDDLIVGTATTVGITTTSDDVQLTTGTTLLIDDDINLVAGDLGLDAGAEVTQNAGDNIAASGLALTNVGPFTLTNTGNAVTTIAANTAATANNTINYVDTNSLVIGSVTVLGATTTGITTTGDDVRLRAVTGGFTITNDINLNSGGAGGAGGDLELTATTGATQTGSIKAFGLALRGSGASINTNRYILTNSTVATANDVARIAGLMTNGHVEYIDLNNLDVDDVTVTTGAAAPVTVTTTGIAVSNPGGSTDSDPDTGAPFGGDVVLRAGITIANVILTANSTLTVTTGNPISTTSGTGGDLLIGGGVMTNAALTLGSGDIDLGGSSPDICIDTATVITLAPPGSTATLQPIGNILVNEPLSTIGGDLTLNADADNDGSGGVWVRKNGSIDADGALFVRGSEITATACDGGTAAIPTVGIQIDDTTAATEINANTSIVLETKTINGTSGNEDDVILTGDVHSDGTGPISIAAENRIVQNSTSTVSLTSAGNIYYQANDMVIDTATAVINAQAAGIVHLRNRSAGLAINVGSTASTASGVVATTLSISNPELNRISTVSAVRIGFNSAFASSPNSPNVLTVAGNAGTITISEPNINVANSTILHLITGADIVDDLVDGTITETNLALEAVTGIDLDNVDAVPTVSGNDVDTLAVRVTGAAANNDAAFKDVDDVTFAVVDSVITPNAVEVVQDLTLIAGGAVTQTAAIVTGGLELIDLFNDPIPPVTFLAFPDWYLPHSSNQIGRLTAYTQRGVNITNSVTLSVETVSNFYRLFPTSGSEGVWAQSLQLVAPTVVVNNPIETNDELGFVTFDVTTLLDINANIFSRGKIEQIGTGLVTIADIELRTTDDNITFLGGVTLDGAVAAPDTTMSTDANWTTPFTGIPLAADAPAQTGGGSIIFSSTLRSGPSGDTAAAYLGNDLDLEAGTGDIEFDGQVGGAGTHPVTLAVTGRLGIVNIIDAHSVTAATGFSANAFYQQAGDGETEFNGFVQTNRGNATNGNGIDITTKMITLNAGMTTTSAPGSGATAAIRFNNSGTLAITAGAGSINSDGPVSQVGTGDNLVGGDIVTTNDNISFASDTYLSGTPIQINSGTGADVSFAARFQINNKTVTIRDKDFVELGTVTAIAGGVLNVFVNTTATRGSVQVGSGELLTGAGTLNTDVAILTGGTLAPAMDASGLGTGILTINGNTTIASGAVYNVDLNGLVAGSSYDQVVPGAGFTFSPAAGSILSANRPVTFNPATGTVLRIVDGNVAMVGTFSNAANGSFIYVNGLYFRADYNVATGDLTLTRQDPTTPTSYIIDDNGGTVGPIAAGGSFTVNPNTTAAWSPNSVAGRGYGSDLRFSSPGGNTATWTFTGLPNGDYRVSTTWYAHSNRATNALFTVTGGVGSPSANLNQRNSPNDYTADSTNWEDIVTTYTVNAGTLTVTLSATGADGYVIADAVRIAPISVSAPEIQVTQGATEITDNTAVVDWGTIAQSSGNVDKVFTVTNTGLSPLILSSATITPPTGFAVIGYAPTSIAAGGTFNFTLRLLDSTAGNFDGQISFATNDADENPFNFRIKGAVLPSDTKIADNPTNPSPKGVYNTISPAVSVGTGMTYVETGNWHDNDDTSVGFQQDLRYAAANTAATATWTFTGLPAGTYRVSVTYRAEPNRASNASFTVDDGAGGLAAVTTTINQRVMPNQFSDANVYWIDLVNAFGSVTSGTITVVLDALGSNGFVIADAIRIERTGPLQAAQGPAAEPTSTVLTTAELDATAAAAIARWQAANLTAEQQAALSGIVFAITELPDGYLGGETQASIFVDPNAAGYGWYIDPTPYDDKEFGLTIADTELQATDPLAASQIDLLTVLMHEIGHRLGLEDVNPADDAHNLMTEVIDVGTRRLVVPVAVAEDAVDSTDCSTELFDPTFDDLNDEVFYTLSDCGNNVVPTNFATSDQQPQSSHDVKRNGKGEGISSQSGLLHAVRKFIRRGRKN